ncbi:MAG: uroporphyrinogen-III C-methyltransferase [Leeuwenhoekiella sp.]
MMTKTPQLILIGAGPGDPELLTLKAVRALQSADVVLYDALVNQAILNHAPQAEQIFVGKRLGCHAYLQDQINELIVQRALLGKVVVRLKGGDPFIFGRGAEEMEFAANAGIKTEIIPGISSAMAVPAQVDIPLTKRGSSQSFWVITGTTKNHKLSEDVYLAAKSKATVVILMGMSKLEEITSIFEKEDKANLPVAIIQNGTLPAMNFAIGTVTTIVKLAAEKKLANPAIIIIGEVVKHHHCMQSLQNEFGKKVLLHR